HKIIHARLVLLVERLDQLGGGLLHGLEVGSGITGLPPQKNGKRAADYDQCEQQSRNLALQRRALLFQVLVGWNDILGFEIFHKLTWLRIWPQWNWSSRQIG